MVPDLFMWCIHAKSIRFPFKKLDFDSEIMPRSDWKKEIPQIWSGAGWIEFEKLNLGWGWIVLKSLFRSVHMCFENILQGKNQTPSEFSETLPTNLWHPCDKIWILKLDFAFWEIAHFSATGDLQNRSKPVHIDGNLSPDAFTSHIHHEKAEFAPNQLWARHTLL